jgi:hypothetical protein
MLCGKQKDTCFINTSNGTVVLASAQVRKRETSPSHVVFGLPTALCQEKQDDLAVALEGARREPFFGGAVV